MIGRACSRRERIFVHDDTPSGIRKRLLVIMVPLLVGFGLVLYRSYSFQVVPHQQIEGLAKNQYERTLPEPIGRGHIYDRRGDELAISVPSFSLVAHPHLIPHPEVTAKRLSSILELRYSSLLKELQGSRKFVWIKRHLTPEEAKLFGNGQEKGLSLLKESKRYYPGRSLSASVLGTVGYDDKGLSGLEFFYDKILRGNAPREVAFRDARGEIFETAETLGEPSDPDRQPAHLILTIDRQIQFVSEQELEAAVSLSDARGGVVVAMDPTNGAILAMASSPSFNPNNFSAYDLSRWQNRATGSLIEPGSTFKLIVAATALESRKVDPSESFYCEKGAYRVASKIIHDHEPYGLLKFSEIMKVSSNIGIFKVAQKVGKELFYETILNFGFGEPTGIDLPGEIAGKVLPVKSWTEIDHATIAFGQGIGTTALQIANAYATVASGGLRWRPYLVDKVVNNHGKIISETTPQIVERVLRPETAGELTTMLRGVVSEQGTGSLAALPGYSIAGKTGTAQKIDPKTKRYSRSLYYSSFVGYAPASDPKIVIFVGIDEPKKLFYGGQIAAPAFRQIALVALQRLKIPPDDGVRYPGKPDPGEPVPVRQASLSLSQANLIQASLDSVMPNLRGLSMREVFSLLSAKGLRVDVKGNGVVVEQKPTAGSPVAKGELCQVFFRPRAERR